MIFFVKYVEINRFANAYVANTLLKLRSVAGKFDRTSRIFNKEINTTALIKHGRSSKIDKSADRRIDKEKERQREGYRLRRLRAIVWQNP